MNTNSDTNGTSTDVCDLCGRDADTVIDDKGLCIDCFHGQGSCCALEFEPPAKVGK